MSPIEPTPARCRIASTVCATLLAVGALVPASRAAPPSQRPPVSAALQGSLDSAAQAFTVQDYPQVIAVLDGLVGHPELTGRAEHISLLEQLASAHWFTGARDAARLIFGTLLRESPFHRLDEFIYPYELIDFFRERRRELVDANVIPARPGESSPEDRGPQRILTRDIRRRDVPTLVYFAPLGIGQFVNDQDGKGTALAILQGIGLATLSSTWLGIESLKVPGTNQIRPEDGGSAKLLNALYYTGLVLFAASWTYGVIDGLVYRQTEPEIDERFEFVDPADLPPVVRLSPGPTGLGLGLDVRW